ncbi:MAG: DNA-binding protein [Desulfurococcales archaeon]|nr:DNA-binding protein [Desulfurococcales archaeon]
MYLFDAGAIFNLVKKGYLKPLAVEATLDLAIYEALNAVWKEYYLSRRLDEETAKKLLSVMGRIFDVIAIANIRSEEKDVFELAVKEGLTIYDAAYLHYALRNKLLLVTDDVKLREKQSNT